MCEFSWTLKRLGGEEGGGGVLILLPRFPLPPVIFQKMYLLKREWNRFFFCDF